MTSGNSSTDPKPNLGKTIMDDFRRGDIERTLRRDFTELKEFMLTEERQKRLRDMRQVKRWLFMAWWFFEGLFLKLTPARRILMLLAILFLVSNVSVRSNGNGANFEGFHIIGALILLFIIMLELKDKLLAHEELEAGHAVQDALMPERTPQVSGWSLWLFTRSANEVGGDLVDFIQITPGRMGITLGDIAGKGLRAALLTAKLQSTIRALVPDVLSLSELGAKLNFIFCRDSLPNLFASVVYAELQPDSGSVRLVNSGHLPPVILRGGRLEKTEKGGIALGLSPQATFNEQRVELGKGEIMFVYSDGLTEARNLEGAFFGEQRVLDLLPQLAPYSAQQIGDRVLEEVDRFVADARAYDDISIAILKRI
jgi:sigma-B regulation protein RsbU (phosphoserine phosphatase)